MTICELILARLRRVERLLRGGINGCERLLFTLGNLTTRLILGSKATAAVGQRGDHASDQPQRSLNFERLTRQFAAVGTPAAQPERTPLAVYTGRLHHNRQLKYLVAAWQTIVGRWPGAPRWRAGEGSNRARLLRQIE